VLDFENEFQRAISAIAEAPERWPVYISLCRRYILHQFPSASCTAISKKMSSSSPSHTRIGVRDIGENGYGNEAGHCAISERNLQASSKWTVSRSARCYPDN
jgi:hypothetical protein